jgi:phosphoglycolate phosphatase
MTTFPFDVVGFDLDGTLLDTGADLGAALNMALVEAGRAPVPLSDVRALIGGGGRRMLERALEQDGGLPDDETVSGLHRALLRHYEANICVHSRPYPGGIDMLDALAARGVRLAVVTNKLESLAVRLLDEAGLLGRFYTVLGGDTLGPGRAKPAPDLLIEMLARAPGARRAAFVGDTTFDTGAARAAGMPSVAVSFGFIDAAPHDLGADAVIDHYDELVPVLERLG